MKTKSVSLRVSSVIGSVSGEYTIPGKSICVMTVAHGAGAGMHHPFMTALATSLAENGITTLRFNFPFMENKKGRPDVPAVAHKTIEAAIKHARKQYPSLPLFISGKSFGGRMSSQYLSTPHEEVSPSSFTKVSEDKSGRFRGASEVRGIIFYGFPLHAPGNPSIERAEHLKDVKQPMLFLSGTRDEFASLKLLEKVCSSLANATLIKIEGANHAFKAGKLNTIEMLGDFTKDWIIKII